MKNNYDFILNFDVVDGTPLSEEATFLLFGYATKITKSLEKYNIKIKKAIISQAVESINP